MGRSRNMGYFSSIAAPAERARNWNAPGVGGIATANSAFGIGMGKGMADDGEADGGSIDHNQLILCDGCFCCFDALYCEFPRCIGCAYDIECLCLREECCCNLACSPILCCKCSGFDEEGQDSRKCCQLGLGFCAYSCLKSGCTCCLCGGQYCCFAGKGAFPCAESVPWTCAFCGLACMPGFGCLKKLGDLTGANNEGGGAAEAPAATPPPATTATPEPEKS